MAFPVRPVVATWELVILMGDAMGRELLMELAIDLDQGVFRAAVETEWWKIFLVAEHRGKERKILILDFVTRQASLDVRVELAEVSDGRVSRRGLKAFRILGGNPEGAESAHAQASDEQGGSGGEARDRFGGGDGNFVHDPALKVLLRVAYVAAAVTP